MSKFPRYVDMEFTARCNLACGFCFGPKHDPTKADLHPDFWRRAVDEVASRGGVGIVVSGGEPTLYAELPQLLAHVRQRGLKVVVSTHGRHASQLEAIAPTCDWIALPADALSRDGLVRMRGDGWGLDQATTLARRLKARTPGVRIKLGSVATRLNGAEILGLARELARAHASPFDTWKIYEYTPRRKFKERGSVYEMTDAEFDVLSGEVMRTGVDRAVTTVLSARSMRRRAYLFVYPDGTVAIPNEGERFGDIVVGNLVSEGMGVFDRASDYTLDANATNFEITYG